MTKYSHVVDHPFDGMAKLLRVKELKKEKHSPLIKQC